jgi:hypothetical protein
MVGDRISSKSIGNKGQKGLILVSKPASKKAPPASYEEKFDGITGAKDRTLNMRLIKQSLDSLWFPEGISDEERLTRMGAAIAMLRGIRPTNEIEGMLATQMVGTHSAAMECLRRAMIQSQTFAGCDQGLKHASKLLSIYLSQMDALNKNRGKGQQKVTVEHIHVEAGAQAVVGNVQTGPKPEAAATKEPPALTHAPGQTLDLKSTRRPATESRRKTVGRGASKT